MRLRQRGGRRGGILGLSAVAVMAIAQGAASQDLSDSIMDSFKTADFPLNGWTYLTDSDAAIVFYRSPVQRPGGMPQVKTRWEFAKTQAGAGGYYQSEELVQEADCVEGRLQVVHRTDYRGHNLAGAVIGEPVKTEPWVAPDPGSLAETVYKKACAPL
jgi:hypothetical protein